MSSVSPQYNPSGKPKPGNFNRHPFLLLYIVLNGISTGNLIQVGRDIINNPGDDDMILTGMLWLLCTIYTADRAIRVYRDIYKNNNDKTR